jgi:hypothetical protein
VFGVGDVLVLVLVLKGALIFVSFQMGTAGPLFANTEPRIAV